MFLKFRSLQDQHQWHQLQVWGSPISLSVGTHRSQKSNHYLKIKINQLTESYIWGSRRYNEQSFQLSSPKWVMQTVSDSPRNYVSRNRTLPVRGTPQALVASTLVGAKACPQLILYSSPSISQADRLLSAGQFQGLRSYLLGVEGKGKSLFGQS